MEVTDTGRELPICMVGGVEFKIDVANCRLIERENDKNTISLLDHIARNKKGYSFVFNPLTKKVMYGKVFSRGAAMVDLPDMVKLDPIGMSIKYGLTLGEVKAKTDFQLMVDQDAYQKRLAGELPVLDLQGHIYSIDIRSHRLVSKDDIARADISLYDLNFVNVDNQATYMLGYNTERKDIELVDVYEIFSKNEVPDNLVPLTFPVDEYLDPIGFNIEMGNAIDYRLRQRGVKQHFEAKIEDWFRLSDPFGGRLTKSINSGKQQGKPKKNKRGI